MRSSMVETHERGLPSIVLYDRYLLIATAILIALGLLMVASTSIVIAQKDFGQPFHFLMRQLIYLIAGLILALFVFRIPLEQWQEAGSGLLLLSVFLLALVLIHGLGRQVNGSMRWLGIGPIGIQVSEFAKVAVIIYLSGYLVRHGKQVKHQILGFVKPMLVLGVVSILLLREPDFGSVAVILLTALGMLFLAGVRVWQFAVILIVVAVALALVAVISPYRVARLTAFLNPWANEFNTGYQLTQSLIAFGRGGWLGVGLGDSVQKLFYLPEAHTDFLFAVFTEELGLVGSLVVVGLFAVVVSRALLIGKRAFLDGRSFAAYLAYGLGLELALQVMINIGVNTGILPTKGLTLPFMSYGGSSLLVMCCVVAILMRIDYESRVATYGYRVQQFGKR